MPKRISEEEWGFSEPAPTPGPETCFNYTYLTSGMESRGSYSKSRAAKLKDNNDDYYNWVGINLDKTLGNKHD
jgi:hypothetical protein